MIQTDKYTCRQLAGALAAFGVKDVVTSPGSRNAPLLMAVERTAGLNVHSVVDERSAAFIALGIAEISGNPVALVCTSGSAVLNYGPAVAEAFYKKIPLVIVSADRAAEWIDQADSQTIRQPGVLSNIVKASYSLKAEAETADERWYVERILNEAIHRALTPPAGPVHINIAIAEPHIGETEISDSENFRKIGFHEPSMGLDTALSRELARHLHDRNVLIIGADNQPSNALNRSISSLAALPNVVIVAEGIANIQASGILTTPDILFSPDADLPLPDTLITFGGAPISARMKKWIRKSAICEHWHIGRERNIVDTYQLLTDTFNYSAESFFPRLAGGMGYLQRSLPVVSDFADKWNRAANKSVATVRERMANAIRSGLWASPLAVNEILCKIPTGWNLQLSNGMAVRYAQLMPHSEFHRVDSNRGVSGIDGCTSTAVGASYAFKSAPTLLITGDMSFIYDIGALSSNLITSRLKIVVLNNRGGGIFKHLASTSGLPETSRLLQCQLDVPIEKLAEAFGFEYIRIDSYDSLYQAVQKMQKSGSEPMLMEIISDAGTDAEVYNCLLN